MNAVLKMPKTDWRARIGFKNVDVVNQYNPPEVTVLRILNAKFEVIEVSSL